MADGTHDVVVRWTEHSGPPADRTAAHLRRALPTEAHIAVDTPAHDADLLVVEAPRPWTCTWRWRSACGAALRSARVPVVVASPRPRALRRCVIAAHAGSTNVDALPSWLASFELEVALALDTGAYASSLAGAPVPGAFVGAALAHAGRAAERTGERCRRLLGRDVEVTQHVGRLEAALFAAIGARTADLVYLADAREVVFLGGTLRWLVEGLGLPVAVPPRNARATAAVSALP